MEHFRLRSCCISKAHPQCIAMDEIKPFPPKKISILRDMLLSIKQSIMQSSRSSLQFLSAKSLVAKTPAASIPLVFGSDQDTVTEPDPGLRTAAAALVVGVLSKSRSKRINMLCRNFPSIYVFQPFTQVAGIVLSIPGSLIPGI